MRPWLRWLLVTSVLASGLSLMWPDDSISRAVDSIDARRIVAPLDARASGPTTVTNEPIPQRLPIALLDKAIADPFADLQPPAPPAPNPLVGPTHEPLAAPPAPPPANYRYLGQLTTPEGKTLVYLARGDRDIAVEVGTQLDDGYLVEAITPGAVQLHFAALDTRVTIPIPEARDTSAP